MTYARRYLSLKYSMLTKVPLMYNGLTTSHLLSRVFSTSLLPKQPWIECSPKFVFNGLLRKDTLKRPIDLLNLIFLIRRWTSRWPYPCGLRGRNGVHSKVGPLDEGRPYQHPTHRDAAAEAAAAASGLAVESRWLAQPDDEEQGSNLG